MSDLFLLSERQMGRIAPHFPLAHGVPRVDDRRVVSGIVYVIKHGLQWKDAPKDYRPHKTLYNRFIRWSRLGVFDRIFAALARADGDGRRRGGCPGLRIPGASEPGEGVATPAGQEDDGR
jgi:transposase